MHRALDVTAAILRRSAYLALLNENPGAMTRLVELCARSRYIADQIERQPALLDELLDPQMYSSTVSKVDLEAELAARMSAMSRERQ